MNEKSHLLSLLMIYKNISFHEDEFSYFLGQKILRAYLSQTSPSLDSPGGWKFSPSGTGKPRVSTGPIQMKSIDSKSGQTICEILAADLFGVLVDKFLDTMAL